MIRMSKLADYGTVVMAQMAHEPERLQSTAEIAAHTHLPATTVSKVLKLLAKQVLVTAERGKHGGYRLSRQPAQISVAEIIDAVDGHFGLTECAAVSGLCTFESSCALRSHWRRISQLVRRAVESETLDQMTAPGTRSLKRIVPRRGERYK
jgi:FeS assembly SUF system regulator